MKSEKIKEKFIELRAQGLSFDKIAKKLKMSKQTLITWSKELYREIHNLKTLELEVLYEKYYFLKRNRIELFGEQLKAIKEELQKRDFSKISTERLLELLPRYYGHLKEECPELTVLKESDKTVNEMMQEDPLNSKSVLTWGIED